MTLRLSEGSFPEPTGDGHTSMFTPGRPGLHPFYRFVNVTSQLFDLLCALTEL